jgi:Secretion system C-terminal sorting domain
VSSVEDIKVNSIGELHITGYTAGSSSSNFPLKKEFSSDVMNTYAGGANDAFVAKFAPCLELKWSTLYGGSGDDQGLGIELAQTNIPDGVPPVLTSVYICGITKSTNFPYQSNSNTNSINDNSLNGTTDGFLAQFDNYHLSAWSTYVGDANNETLNKLEFGGTGVLYVIGETSSPSFVNIPVSGIYNQAALGGGLTTNNRDACLLAFNKNTNYSTMWSTFYGGKSPIGYPGSEDYAYGIAISNNVVYICGQTYSQNNFPLFADLVNHPTAYLQNVLGSGQDIYQDGFLATIEVTGTPLKVEEMQKQIDEMGIYPNPSSGVVILKLKRNSGKRQQIEVYDLQGKKVFQTSTPDIGDVPVLLDLSHLINGMYFVKVIGDGNSITKKLIIGR